MVHCQWGRFKLLKGNVVEFYLTLREDEPRPYEAKSLLPVDLKEDGVPPLVDPTVVETGVNGTWVTNARGKTITSGKSTESREVGRALHSGRGSGNSTSGKVARLIVGESQGRYCLGGLAQDEHLNWGLSVSTGEVFPKPPNCITTES